MNDEEELYDEIDEYEHAEIERERVRDYELSHENEYDCTTRKRE